MLSFLNNGAVGNGDILAFHCREGMKTHRLFLMMRETNYFLNS